MASLIPKLDLSAITNKGEVQASLVAWNWDFSLVKLEAPKEFGEVQNAISSLRKSNAENGDLHKTARRLGALFEGASPDAPHLLRAYGTRVSEICTLKNIEHHKNTHGIFAGWSGLDAASIWAAATSGDHAIAIHLLACMIAEIYDSQSAAVALWTELVHRRKERLAIEIENSTDQIKREAKMVARLQDISRADLAAWDNSARAWVRTANEAKQKERQRVMLRVEKIGLYVNNVTDPYDSVMRAWKDAMEAIDKLVQGIPQRVDDGAIPLGIGAWHLYPNLNVLSEGPDPVLQNDPLIPSTAILTIDYEARAEAESGIRWSLPLSYMRYYGPPVNTEQRITIDSSRITMNQFGFVLLGCAIAQWHDFLKPVSKAVGFAVNLLEALRTPARSNVKNQDHIARMQKITARSSWIGQLLRAAEEFETGDKDEREIALKLINYGRRCSGFICDDRDHPPPYFGLCEIKPLFRLLNGSEHRIAYLRELARHWDLSNQNCIIQYRHIEKGAEVIEYCSIKPFVEQFGYTAASEGYLRRRSRKPVGAARFGRWLTVYSKNTTCNCKGPCLRPEDIQIARRAKLFTKKEVACPCWENGGCGLACHDWNKTKVSDCGSLHNGLLLRRRDEITKMGELCAIAHRVATDRDPDNGKVEFGVETDLQSALVEFAHEKAVRDKARAKNKSTENLPGYFLSFQFAAGCQGDRASAAIVATGHITKSGVDPRKGKPGGDLRQIGEFLPAKVMDVVFDPSHFDFHRLTEWFATDLRANHRNYVQPLRATAATMEIYTRLGPDATIKTSITDKSTLKSARWIPHQEEKNASPLRIKLSKAEAFACIAMFESGGLNIDPVGLKEVFAMTSGNSIFVSSSVICDPFTQPSENEIQRVPGNIGESGLSFLIPPSNPLVKSKRETDWSVINHHPFSGEFEPNFEKTSIHLLKTGFASELRGMHDKGYFIDREATLLEIAAQVFHGEEWIGDLDILSALQGSMLTRAACQHQTAPNSSNNQHGKAPYSDVFADDEIVNADCWDEVLTEALDSHYVIVRASGEQVSGGQSNTSVKSNQWLARLAASAISVQLGNRTVILPLDVCWLCVKTHLESLGETRVVLIG
ncbi:hypothetical protein F5X98DRAFT_179954 [Xylaria grammica]|nr:hypothetical protein F5X98DRAFT_179954 [Xylaria grammica]